MSDYSRSGDYHVTSRYPISSGNINPRSYHDRSERAGIGTAIDKNILPGDITRLSRAEERAGRAKLFRASKSPRRIAATDIFGYRLGRAFGTGRKRLQVGFQPVGIERARQQ